MDTLRALYLKMKYIYKKKKHEKPSLDQEKKPHQTDMQGNNQMVILLYFTYYKKF